MPSAPSETCTLPGTVWSRTGLRAAELIRCAAEQGDVEALSCLAECYEAGCGVPCDLDRAIALYDQAAALGDGYAHEEGEPPAAAA